MLPIVVSVLVLMCASSIWSHRGATGPGTWDDATVDKQHIKEHMRHKVQINLDKADEDELRFHYFKLHDLNDDVLLDGLELLDAISHDHERYVDVTPAKMEQLLQESIVMVDDILRSHDGNNDGYIDYLEYKRKH